MPSPHVQRLDGRRATAAVVLCLAAAAAAQGSCSISSPAMGSTQGGDIAIVFGATHPTGLPVQSMIEWSTNGGASWSQAAAAPGSPIPNPDAARATPFTGVTFLWDSSADGIGLTMPRTVGVRVRVFDGMMVGSCAVPFTVVNFPACSITAPASGASVGGNVTITYGATDPSNDPVSAQLTWSTDGGTVWWLAATAPGSPTANPAPPRATPFSGVSFHWDSSMDGRGLTAPESVLFRVLVLDSGGGGIATPSVSFTVSNFPACNISAPASGASLGGNVTITYGATDPSNDPVIAVLSWSTDGGTVWWLAATAPGSPTANPAPPRATPFSGVSFLWDSSVDGRGLTAPENVLFRLQVYDAGSGLVSSSVSFTVSNFPACSISAPASGASLAGNVSLTFGATDPSNHPVFSTVSWSTNGGAFWVLARAATSSPISNPDGPRATPFASLSFVWDSTADFVGLTGPTSTLLRVQVFEATGGLATCTVSITVSNFPSCAIASPAVGSAQAGAVSIVFSGTQSTSRPVVSTFEWSTDAGASWNLATATPASPTANPDGPRATPFVGVGFTWDTQADGVGLGALQNVSLRVSVADSGGGTGSCGRAFTVTNSLGCLITSPAPSTMAGGDVGITYNVTDSGNDAVTTAFSFSTDAGATFAVATAAPSSPTASPDPLRPTPITARVFVWDSQADGVGLAVPASVLFRVAVDDGYTPASCQVAMVLVDNVPTCSLSSPLPGAAVTGDVALVFGATDPASDPLTATLEVSTDGGATWALTTAAPGSPTPNPDPLRPTPYAGVTFLWSTAADGVGLGGAQVTFVRITVDNGVASGSCSLMLFVDNQPTCAITVPLMGAVATRDLGLVFDAADPSNDLVTATFEFSTDVGATWMLATPSLASLVPNPDGPRATPFTGLTFTWDSATDVPTLLAPQGVLLRITVADGVATGQCQVAVTADNTDVCLGVCGDCNQNGLGPNLLDALQAAQHAVGLLAPGPQSACCDVNSSGGIDIIDALVIARTDVGLVTVLACR